MADAPDLNQLTDTTNRQRASTQTLLANQGAQTSDYLKRYTDFIGGQEGASAMAKRIGEELGIPTLQANATMLRNTMTNLPTTYSKAMTGFDVNQNQLNRVIGQKSSELAPALTTAENSLQTAQGNLNTRMGYEQYDQTRQEKPYAMEKDILSERQARETTLFSQDNENELTALINKINAGVTLSEGEKNRANQLAIAEKTYQLELKKLEQNQNQFNSTQNGRAPISTDTGDWMWDSSTGQWAPVYD